MSTSPHCEPPDFVASMRAKFQFTIDNPDAEQFFGGKAREYQRDEQRRWIKLD